MPSFFSILAVFLCYVVSFFCLVVVYLMWSFSAKSEDVQIMQI
jgi:Ca2+/Na+ antiporter